MGWLRVGWGTCKTYCGMSREMIKSSEKKELWWIGKKQIGKLERQRDKRGWSSSGRLLVSPLV